MMEPYSVSTSNGGRRGEKALSMVLLLLLLLLLRFVASLDCDKLAGNDWVDRWMGTTGGGTMDWGGDVSVVPFWYTLSHR